MAKKWLISLILTQSLLPLTSVLFISHIFFDFSDQLYLLSFTGIPALIFTYSLYRCAYNKPGTIWLQWGLVIILLLNLYDWYDYVIYHWHDSKMNSSLYPNLLVLLNLNTVGNFVFLFLSLKLIKLNRKLQFKCLPRTYLKQLKEMRNFKTKEELHHHFHQLIKEWPQYEFFSSKYLRKWPSYYDWGQA